MFFLLCRLSPPPRHCQGPWRLAPPQVHGPRPLGFCTNSIEVVLPSLAAGSLAEDKKSNALLKRAELKITMSERRVDSVLADLTESVKAESAKREGMVHVGGVLRRKQNGGRSKEGL